MKEALVHFKGRDVVVTGTPVRGEMKQAPSRNAAAEKFGLDPQRPILVVMGGSQGAQRLNALVAEAFDQFPAGTQVLHVAGSADEARVREQSAGRAGYVVLGFCDDMASVYAVADLILCRAGASSMTELAHAGLPSILVPYPYAADDHQTKNAEVFAAAGAAKMVQQADLDAAGLASMVDAIIGREEVIMKMKTSARSLDVPDAAARVCSAMEAALK
jgi:UDP-N-acetylglucosamine--N-acetylmuramyl-(pentapeptide) pyrophosphoryl-undecaprenol N-acetylglucosamine transferase